MNQICRSTASKAWQGWSGYVNMCNEVSQPQVTKCYARFNKAFTMHLIGGDQILMKTTILNMDWITGVVDIPLLSLNFCSTFLDYIDQRE